MNANPVLIRGIKITALVTAVVGLCVALFVSYLWMPHRHEATSFEVREGESVRSVARRLESENIIQFSPLFVFYARISGQATRIKAGEYMFDIERRPIDVLNKMADGRVVLHKVRMLEGWSIRDFAHYLSTLTYIRIPDVENRILERAFDPSYTRSLGIAAHSLEGYLFPETYLMSAPKSAEAILEKMVLQWNKSLDESMRQRASEMGMSIHQVMTLASIIEKETGAGFERPLVSSVFHNRLKKGMALESDPTIIYGLPHFDGDIRRKDIRNPHPYNTYVHAGLPPGPIANPGLASIKAALYPATTDYLFFVSQNDGTHIFSANYRDHVNAVNEYQRRKRTEKSTAPVIE